MTEEPGTIATEDSVYRVNAQNIITEVNEAFLNFARENNAPLKRSSDYTGKRLGEFITGRETASLMQDLLDQVRKIGKPVTVKYRCDAPDLIRVFDLRMTPEPNGDIELRSHLVNAIPREPVQVLDASQQRSKEIVKMCSWCKKVLVGADEFADIDSAIDRLKMLQDTPPPQISHTMCPACKKEVWKEWMGESSN